MKTPLEFSRLGRAHQIKMLLAFDLGTSQNTEYLRYGAGGVELVEGFEKEFSNVYRVQIHTSYSIHVIKLGMGVDEEVEGIYSGIDALPDWIKERLAVLMVLDAKQKTDSVENVGKRISEYVFWVFAPEDHADATAST